MRPELDNHWALRDFAARLMAQICKNFNTSTNNLQTRVTRLFSNALQNEKTQLSSLYGAVAGLSELGTEVIKVFIVPRLRFVSDRIEPQLHGGTGGTDKSISNTDKIAAGHIRAMLQKTCAPVLKTTRNAPDLVDDYKRDYGFLGLTLHQAVVKARNTLPTAGAVAAAGGTVPMAPATTVGLTSGATPTPPAPVSVLPMVSSFVPATPSAGANISGASGTIGRIVVGPVAAAATAASIGKTNIISNNPGLVRQQQPANVATVTQPKYVIVQRPTTPLAVIGANATVGALATATSVASGSGNVVSPLNGSGNVVGSMIVSILDVTELRFLVVVMVYWIYYNFTPVVLSQLYVRNTCPIIPQPLCTSQLPEFCQNGPKLWRCEGEGPL